MLERYVNDKEFEEFLHVAETGDIERGDLQDNLRRIAFLAMTGHPKLKEAVAALREDLNCHELAKFYGWTYANFVDELFEKEIQITTDYLRWNDDNLPLNVPIVGGTCELQQAPQVKLRVCRALAAMAQFEAEKPVWAPELPVRCEDIETLRRGRMRAVGHYANSWYWRGWGALLPAPIVRRCGVLQGGADAVDCSALAQSRGSLG
jgi:hypothetical protein